jgi:hypothetical protein
MRAESVVAYLLSQSAAVAGYVGSGASARIYGGLAKQGAARPLVVYRKLTGVRDESQNAEQLNTVDATVEVIVVADRYEDLKNAGEEVRKSLAFQFGVIAGVQVTSIVCRDEGPDEYDPEEKVFGQSWTFDINHLE